MKMLRAVLVIGSLVCLGTIMRGQDPVKSAPGTYKALLENDQVRVLDIVLKAGEKSPMHSHPNSILYGLSSGTVRFTYPDGKTTDAEFKVGECLWRPAEKHEPQNIGKTDVHVLQIELKR